MKNLFPSWQLLPSKADHMGSFIPPSLDGIFTGNYNLSVFQIIIYWVNVFSDTFIQYLNIRKCEYLMVTRSKF